MKTRFLFLIAFLASLSAVSVAQKIKLNISDYENKPNTEKWWRDNSKVTFTYDENSSNQVSAKSMVCLHIRWDSIPKNQKSYTWFTDLKADTFVSPGMETIWKEFKSNIWISFYCRLGDGDTLMLHPMILSKGHTSKWGSKNMMPFTSKSWTFVKVKFSDLEYENWGKIVMPLDLNSDAGKCFEIGLRLGASLKKDHMDAWFDNIQLTNYEPFE